MRVGGAGGGAGAWWFQVQCCRAKVKGPQAREKLGSWENVDLCCLKRSTCGAKLTLLTVIKVINAIFVVSTGPNQQTNRGNGCKNSPGLIQDR